MTDYTWPSDLQPHVVTFYLQPHTGRSVSPFTRTMKTYGLSRPRWICRLSFRGGYDGRSAEAAYGPRLDVMIAKLKGGENRVELWDFRRPAMRGPDWETDATNSAAAAGATSMELSGFAPYARAVLEGDYVGGDGRPHLIMADATADASGNVTVTFEPPLEAAIAAGAAVFGSPTGLFKLIDDDAGANGTSVGELVNYDLEFVEDI